MIGIKNMLRGACARGADRRGNFDARLFFGIMALVFMLLAPAEAVHAKSASSPRHSGLEPPGGPRNTEIVPGMAPARTPEGGMGYVDAYGNSLTDRQPEEKKPRKRPRPGAYGGPAKVEDNYLPDPASAGAKPLWRF